MVRLYNYTPSSQLYGSIKPAETVKSSEPGLLSNMGRAAGSGALSGVGGIFDFVGADGIAKQFYGWSDDARQSMSQEAQADMAKPFFSENDQGDIQLGEGLTDLDTWLLTMANVAGQFAPTAIPGAGLAGTATKALKLGETGAKIATAVGMGATGGASATGQGMEQARQEWLQMPDELKLQSDLFKNTIREMKQAKPELDGEALWTEAENNVAERLAAEVQTDPKVLLANFAGSAIADPIIGRALTGARLAKSGALRSALKGFAIEGGTEAAQAGVQEYGINQALSQVDGRDPMDGVAVAALNEGVAGGTLGAAAGGVGGLLNRKQEEPVRDPEADAIRDKNPDLASAFDGMAQSAAQREADLQSIIGGMPAISQPVLEGELLDPEQAPGPNYNPNQIGMQPRIGGPTIPRIEQKDIIFAADGRTEAERNPAMEGEWLSPEQRANAAAGFIENAPIDLESEQVKQAKAEMERMRNQPRQITDKNIIFTGDGRPQQAAQEFTDNLQRQANQAASVPRLPQKDIIFAGDQSGVRVKGNGQVYQSAREAMTSKQARAMKRSGTPVEAVPFGDGWGWRVKESQPEQMQQPDIQPEQTVQPVEPAPIQLMKSGRPFSTQAMMLKSASYKEAAATGAELEPVKVEGGYGFRVKVAPAADLSGGAINDEWTAFADDSGTLKIPRAEMPQIKAEHRGAMTQFLKARGVSHEQDTVPAAGLKPTQAEFSPSKVAKAMEFDGGDRSILVSSDGYVLDGHHQWLAKRERGEEVDIIRFDAPIAELVKQAHEFPSSTVADGANIESNIESGTNNPDDTIKNQEGSGAQQGGLFTAGNAGASESGTQSGQERQGSSAERSNGPDPEQPEKPAVTTEPATQTPADAGVSVSEPLERIDDFGEKLGGARKDVWAGFSEAVSGEVDTRELPLSKSFPEPDYVKMAADGVSMETLAIIAAMRSEIPAKPRVSYKVRRWAEKVDVLRNFARDLISGELTPDQVIAAMSKSGGELQAMADAIPAIAQANPETIKLAAKYRLGSGSFSMFRGKQYSPSKTFYYPQNGGTEILDLASPDKQGALDNLVKLIKAEAAANPDTAGQKQSKISIYSDRYTKQIYLGWAGGSGVLRIQDFATVNEAREYLKSNRADVEAKLKQLKQVPEMRRPENRKRVGPPHYAGSITPAIFADTFGFRGVEFGNWVEQGKRQRDLNEAYDALMDLADVLGVPPKALALNGELGMAFGARGKGAATTIKAAAHYEPSYVAINLTKESGAGSLAHEWWHAVDNYFARLSGNPNSFVTEGGNIRGGDLRQEVRDAFTALILAIRKTKMFQRASTLDSRRSKPYWSSEIEASARSFETFIIAELEAKGFSNDYLANVVDPEVWGAVESAEQTYPYPTKAEQEIINPAFRAFFDTLQTKETDKGVMLFSKQNTIKAKPARGVNAKLAKQMVSNIMQRLNGAAGIKVVVLETQAEAEKLWQMSLSGDLVRGAYNRATNTAYVIAENVKSLDELREVVAHEVIGHGGLQNVISKADYTAFIDRLKQTRNNRAFAKQWVQIDNDYDGFSENDKAEELFAYFVQNKPVTGPVKFWWNALKRFLHKALVSVGLAKAGDPDVEAMQDMLDSISAGFMFSRNQSDSTSERAVLFSRVPDSAPIVELGNSTINIGTLKEMVVAAREYAKAHLAGKTFINKDTGHAVSVSMTGVRHTLSGAQADLISSIEAIPELIERSIYIGSEPDAKRAESGLIFHYYAAKLSVDSRVHDVITVVREAEDGKRYYDHSFERKTDAQSALPSNAGNQASESNDANAPSDESINHEQTGYKFSKARTTEQADALDKLGLGEEDAETIAEQAKRRANETVETLKSSSFWKRLNEGIFDGLAGIKQAEEAAGITDPNKQGYVSARLASGLSDILHGVFHYGAPVWKDGVVQRKADTKGLLEVFGMLGDDLNEWLAWMGANRAERLMAEGRENNLSQADIDELKAMAAGKEDLFEQVRQEYNKINSAIIDLAEEAGLISAEQRGGFDEEWYVPFFRNMENEVDPEMSGIAAMVHGPRSRKGIAGQSAQIKELKGGRQSTKDLLENIIARQSTMIDAAIKNKAMAEVVSNLEGTPFMQAVDSPDIAALSQTELNLLQKVKVMRNGKAEAYTVTDPALLRGLLQIHTIGNQSLFNRMARSAKRFLTAGITLSPDFIIKNFVRDAAHAWMINKDGFRFGADSVAGLRKAFAEDEAYRDLIFSGAAFQGGYVHGADPEAAAQQVRRALRSKGLGEADIQSYMDSLITKGGQLLEAYRTASDKVENANRLSTYEAALASGKSRRQAAYEAKDLMDYSLKGNFALIGTMIDMLPFFNARLQGMSKLVRAMKAGDGDRVLKVLSANLAMKGLKVAAFSLALAAMNDDDERYQELPDWDKDANWHFFIGDEHFRIPKPFELGILFGTMPERMFHYAAGSQPGSDLGKAAAHAVWNTLALNPIPQLALPVVEVMTNKSFFKGSQIEGMGDAQRKPEDRYNAYTSETAKQIGAAFGVSPKMVEHLILGYTGTLGGYILGMSDIAARQMLGIEAADTPISRYPVIKAFYQGDAPKTATKFQDEFYKALEEATEAHGSYKRAVEEGNVVRQQDLKESESLALGARVALNRIQRRLSELNKQAELVNNNQSLSGTQKRQKLDDITKRKNELYQNAYLRYKLGEW
jgi:hypothetical protein